MDAISLRGLALVLTIITAGSLGTQWQTAYPANEATHFSEYEPLSNSAAVSPDVLNLLLKTKEVEMGLKLMNDSQRSGVAGLFRATHVHLGGPGEIDSVVVGIPPMSGADEGWFWLLRSVHKNPKIVLFATGNSLDLMESRTLGYRDIRSVWSSASDTHQTVYHFDGNEYKLWTEKWTENHH